jgi:hypothetical protein
LESDASSSDELPAPTARLSTTQIATLTNTILVNAPEDSSRVDFSHLSASAKKIKNKTATDLVAILEEQADAAAAVEDDQEELNEELIARGVWNSSKEVEIAKLCEIDRIEGSSEWLTTFLATLERRLFSCQAECDYNTDAERWQLAGAQRNPVSLRSTTELFSPIYGRGSPIDRLQLVPILFSLVCHPSTAASLAERLIVLLERILRFISTDILHPGLSLYPLSAHVFMSELKKFGAKETLVEQKREEKDDDMLLDEREETPVPGLRAATITITARERSESVRRLLRILAAVSDLKSVSPFPMLVLSAADIQSIITVYFLRLIELMWLSLC